MEEVSNTFDTKTEVTAEAVSGFGVTENYFANRVESVDDRATNNALFSLYKELIEPVEEIERFTMAINRLEEQRKRYEASVRVKRWPSSVLVIVFCVTTFFTSYFITHVGFLIELMNKLTDVIPQYDFIAYLAVSLIVPIILISIIQPIVRAIVRKSRKKKNEAMLPEIDASIADLVNERNEKTRAIANRICYVPPKYRSSRALSDFVTDYGNSKVDNLKEAIIAYDRRCHEAHLTEGLAMIYRRLRDIEYLPYNK